MFSKAVCSFFLFYQIIVSLFVHVFAIISLFVAEMEDSKFGILGKWLKDNENSGFCGKKLARGDQNLSLFTGRSHQLRVHCDYIGHRVVGDFTYSLRQDTAPERMMLHAFCLQAAMKKESIDVTTADPFISEVLPGWTVDEKIKDVSIAKELALKFDPLNSENFVKT